MDKYRNCGTVPDSPGKGRRKVSHRTKRSIIRIILLTKLLMVWGGISYTGRTRLKLSSGTSRANNYISDILGPKISGFWAEHRTLQYFMQNNARLHVARTSLEWHRSRNNSLIERPLFSPDLNPIEIVWALMKREISEKSPKTLKPSWEWLGLFCHPDRTFIKRPFKTW